MKQKVRFIFASRAGAGTARNVAEKSLVLVEHVHAEFARAFYNRASLSTHVSTSRGEALKLRQYVNTLLCDLLELRL